VLALGGLCLISFYFNVGTAGALGWLAYPAALGAVSGILAAPMILQWGGDPCWRILDNRPLHWLGERSYSLYLVHMVPMGFLRPALLDLADGSPWDMLVVLAVAELLVLIPTGALMYRFVERPFLRLKLRRRSGSLRPLPVRATAG
jgi:peptidoglycan/LPS O-acetylase OafA/YrhL